jgi:CheY-like chemotaxis protein
MIAEEGRLHAPEESSMATILIVDDLKTGREPMVQLLRECGHQVLWARNAWHALSIIETEGADAILLDLCLPGLDGAGFLNELRRDARWRHLPVIVVTGLNREDAAARVRGLNVCECLIKGSFSADELLEHIESVVPRRLRRMAS